VGEDSAGLYCLIAGVRREEKKGKAMAEVVLKENFGGRAGGGAEEKGGITNDFMFTLTIICSYLIIRTIFKCYESKSGC
jgi:hypothetical protein